jgi:hypothetical protein
MNKAMQAKEDARENRQHRNTSIQRMGTLFAILTIAKPGRFAYDFSRKKSVI